MEQINTFAKALIGDIDNQYVDNQQLVFPSLNIRLTNAGDRGFVPTTLAGTKMLETFTEYFNETFRINGACEYNGILYVAFTFTDVGKFAIQASGLGCYPRPKTIGYDEASDLWIYDEGGTGFEREFAPLMNFDPAGMGRSEFITSPSMIFEGTCLNFDSDEHVKMFAKPSYDGSVDLYIISKNNPNRVINTGFNYNGELTDRIISIDMFNGGLDLVLLMKEQPTLNISELKTLGKLKPGKYFFFLRYLTESFNRTEFSRPSKGVPIANGPSTWIHSGMQEKHWPDDKNLYSDKSIELTINDLNEDFRYFEIGVVRYSSLNENEDASADIYLIDKYYDIDNVSSASNKIVISGNEGQRIMTESEILQVRNTYYKCNTQTEINDRYLGGNWKSYYDETYETLAKAYAISCELSEFRDSLESDITFDDHYTSGHTNNQFNIIDNIINETPYFPNEVYAFGMYITFLNGYRTKIYPLTGNDTDGGTRDSKGLFQFSDFAPLAKRKIRISYEDIDVELSSIKNEIDGIYIVRTDRFHNLIYTGFLDKVFNRIDATAEITNYFGSPDLNGASAIPLTHLDGDFPYGKNEDETDVTDANYNYNNVGAEPKIGHFALWAPDFILGKRGVFYDSEELYMRKIASISVPANSVIDNYVSYENIRPNKLGIDINQTNLESDFLETAVNASVYAYKIEQFVFKGAENFSSYFADGQNEVDNSAYKFDGSYNRSIKTLPYIGIKLTDDAITDSENNQWGRSLVYLFKNNPDTILDSIYDSFNIESTQYIDIGNKVKSTDVDTVGYTQNIYEGDCYNQKSFWRTISHFGFDNNAHVGANGELDHMGHYSATGIIYMHARMLGLWSLNSINAQLRNDVISVGEEGALYNYTWFPYLRKRQGFHGWFAWGLDDDNVFESLQINDGYRKDLLQYGRLGFNKYEYNNNEFKNRVFLSAKQESGSYIDNYRNIAVTAYQDYNISGGAIISLQNYMGKVFAVQENAIIEIFIGEEKVQQSESGQMIIAKAEQLISDKFHLKSEFGAQEEKAIVKTQTGVYGVDQKKKILWKVGYVSSENGQYLGVENYGEKIGIQGELNKAMLVYPENIDIVSSRPKVFDGNVIAGYDPKEKEVHFTFKYVADIKFILVDPVFVRSLQDNTSDYKYYFESHGLVPNEAGSPYNYISHEDEIQSYSGDVNVNDDNFITFNIPDAIAQTSFHVIIEDVEIKKTIVISEKYQKSMGLRSYHPQMYFNLETDMITQHYDTTDTQYYIHLHNIGKHNEFYGSDHISRVAFIVNGTVSEQENYSVIEKLFESIAVRSKIKPSEAFFFTNELYSHYDYSNSVMGLKAQIWKNEWLSPIPPTIIDNESYQLEGRQMEGISIKVMIEFESNNGYVNWVKSVKTKFSM